MNKPWIMIIYLLEGLYKLNAKLGYTLDSDFKYTKILNLKESESERLTWYVVAQYPNQTN